MEIVNNETTLKLETQIEHHNQILKTYISDCKLPYYEKSKDMSILWPGSKIDNGSASDWTALLERNSLLAKRKNIFHDPLRESAENTKYTGCDVLSIILHKTENKDMLDNICLLKMENYYLTEHLIRLILQSNVDDITESLRAHKYTGNDTWIMGLRSSSMTHVCKHVEPKLKACSDKIAMVRSMNIQLRQLFRCMKTMKGWRYHVH